jgi:glycosyltransferase involved in cell wall biosynthesis
MVTADRSALSRRAILCYRRQRYPNRELVIIDDGREDLSPLLSDIPASEVRYIRLEKRPEHVLGYLRNLALQHATGSFLTQWDDDDWYHPDRLSKQAAVLRQGYDACSLSGALMHLDTPEYFDHPYIGYLKDGIPGSIMHRRDDSIRYPEMRRAEDTVYLDHWRKRRYILLPASEVHLFIRCFHGTNTWEQAHFLTRMRNTLPDLVAYLWFRYVRQDLFLHPRFKLGEASREAFDQFLEDSRRLALSTS